MVDRLQALSNIGAVSVTRDGPTAFGGYTWSITFDSTNELNWGDLPELECHQASLTSKEPGDDGDFDCYVSTVQDGRFMDGTFAVSIDGAASAPLEWDTSAADMATALEAIDPSVGTVTVTRSRYGYVGGYTWTVSFVTTRGEVSSFAVDANNLGVTSAGLSPTVEVGTGTWEVQVINVTDASLVSPSRAMVAAVIASMVPPRQ